MTFAISTIIPVISTKTDIFIAYHPPPSVIIPIIIKNFFSKTKFIYWINDMWPETLEVLKLSPLISKTLHKIHAYIYSKAMRIVVLSEGFKQNLKTKGVSEDKIEVIHNWINLNEFKIQKSNNDIYSKYNIKKNNFHIVYAGSQGKMQQLEVLIRAFKNLESYPNIKFLLLGTGTEHENLKKIIKLEKLNHKVFMLGRVPTLDLPYLYNIADAMIIHLKSLEINNSTIPHKIYGYMAAKKPIIGAIKGDAANEIKRSNSGYTCDPGSPKKVSDIILKMYNHSNQERKSFELTDIILLNKIEV